MNSEEFLTSLHWYATSIKFELSAVTLLFGEYVQSTLKSRENISNDGLQQWLNHKLATAQLTKDNEKLIASIQSAQALLTKSDHE